MRGREEELAKAVQAWESARQGRVGHVRVTGEPGVGKTRLVQAFYEILSTRYDPTSKEFPEGYWPDLLSATRLESNLKPPLPKPRRPSPRNALPLVGSALY
jgi:Mg-chelatase subunit ChlI